MTSSVSRRHQSQRRVCVTLPSSLRIVTSRQPESRSYPYPRRFLYRQSSRSRSRPTQANNKWMTDQAKEVTETARLAHRAVGLGKDDAVALGTGGFALAYVVHEADAGAAFIDRALVLNPNLATVWFSSGCMRYWLGKPDLAIEHLARAVRLSPLDPLMPVMQNAAAHAHFVAGRYDEASSCAEMALRELPETHSLLRIAACGDIS